jgi:hypothetical protein
MDFESPLSPYMWLRAPRPSWLFSQPSSASWSET